MSLSNFFKLGLILSVGVAILQVVFGSYLNIQDQSTQLLFFSVIAVFAVIVIRRGGVLNYIEAMVVAGGWCLFLFYLDFIIVSSKYFLTLSMFKQLYIWIGYVVMMLGVFIFHKKRHVHIRKGDQMHY